MDLLKITQSVDRALAEARELHHLLDELPVRTRAKVMRKLEAQEQDPIYAPWGGLFPHPRLKKEVF